MSTYWRVVARRIETENCSLDLTTQGPRGATLAEAVERWAWAHLHRHVLTAKVIVRCDDGRQQCAEVTLAMTYTVTEFS
jgi:hypothetical protein